MKWRDDGGRGDLTERQWQKLQPLLPPQKAHTGQPCYDHRRILNGILWLHRTGAPWRDIPERYGKHSTISSRFYRWRTIGLWQRIWENLMQQADAVGDIDARSPVCRQHDSSSAPTRRVTQKGGARSPSFGT